MNPRLSNRFERGLVARIMGVRRYHRWCPTTDETLPERLMYTIAEIDEFLGGTTAEDVHSELGDVAISLIVPLEDLHGGNARAFRSYTRVDFGATRYQIAGRIRAYVILAFEHWRRKRETRGSDIRISLELALLETCKAADALDIDLDAQIHLNLDKLKQRPQGQRGSRA